MLRAGKAPVYIGPSGNRYEEFCDVRELPASFVLGLLHEGGKPVGTSNDAHTQHFTRRTSHGLEAGMHPIFSIGAAAKNAMHFLNSAARGFQQGHSGLLRDSVRSHDANRHF
eukprot:g27821.t1